LINNKKQVTNRFISWSDRNFIFCLLSPIDEILPPFEIEKVTGMNFDGVAYRSDKMNFGSIWMELESRIGFGTY